MCVCSSARIKNPKKEERKEGSVQPWCFDAESALKKTKTRNNHEEKDTQSLPGPGVMQEADERTSGRRHTHILRQPCGRSSDFGGRECLSGSDVVTPLLRKQPPCVPTEAVVGVEPCRFTRGFKM